MIYNTVTWPIEDYKGKVKFKNEPFRNHWYSKPRLNPLRDSLYGHLFQAKDKNKMYALGNLCILDYLWAYLFDAAIKATINSKFR